MHTKRAIIGASLAAVAVSMISGFLLGSYVMAGTAPAEPGKARADRESPRFIDDNWSPPAYAAPVN